MFKNPFSFEGRIRRTEFGLSFILYIIATVIVRVIMTSGGSYSSIIIEALVYIPMLWFLLAQSAKRCHDIGNSGWCQFIPFYYLWLLFRGGQSGSNQYGKNPKGDINYERRLNKKLWRVFLGGFSVIVLIFLCANFGLFGKMPSLEQLQNPEADLASRPAALGRSPPHSGPAGPVEGPRQLPVPAPLGPGAPGQWARPGDGVARPQCAAYAGAHRSLGADHPQWRPRRSGGSGRALVRHSLGDLDARELPGQ